MWKKIIISLITVLLILAVWQHELISYGLAQGKGQLRIIRNTQEVADLMSDPEFPDSLKAKIQIIENARRFAVEDLGLKDSENYTTYFEEGDSVTLWNVSACEPFAFRPKTWWFPFVGSVPYKGYFDKRKAERLVKELREDGWDARMRPVGGWSTLGWFKDPILSSMLERSEGRLADLIIHELTHGTVFVKDQVTFNENLASFIGEQGAIAFLGAKYGHDSIELLQYQNAESDSEKFTQHILLGTKKLDSLYRLFSNETDSLKSQLKNQMIERICTSIDTVSFVNERYRNVFQNGRPNNAYFMSYLRYHSAGDSLQNLLDERFQGNLKLFIQDAVDRYGD